MNTAPVTVSAMLPEHAEQVLAIYRLGIDGGDATFETSADLGGVRRLPPRRTPPGRRRRQPGTGLGWAAAVSVCDRCAYAGVVEHSVYVHPDARGQGVGLALHTRAGFRVVGTRERLGRHRARWRDVVLVERRSPAVS